MTNLTVYHWEDGKWEEIHSFGYEFGVGKHWPEQKAADDAAMAIWILLNDSPFFSGQRFRVMSGNLDLKTREFEDLHEDTTDNTQEEK